MKTRTISDGRNLRPQWSEDGVVWHDGSPPPTGLMRPEVVLKRIALLVEMLPGQRKGIDLHMLESTEAFAMLVQLGGVRGVSLHLSGAIEHVSLAVGGLRVMAQRPPRPITDDERARLVAAGALSMEDTDGGR